MARRTTRTKLADLPAQPEATTELDSAQFLAAAGPVLKLLKADLSARAKGSVAVTRALKARHAAEKAAKRTADGFVAWQGRFVEQVAAAWLLSCVFVRTLEDRGLTEQARLAGPGAMDSQRLFFELAPSLSERDYLLTVFQELTRFGATKALFDARHNPVWLLAPSAEASKALLALFRTPNPEAPAFRFGQGDTRFLGDLYQDLDEGVRKRFALLQTPRFVEAYILDKTLDRAIERFGLNDTTLIDPTCGSGHFLLGAFARLYERRRRAQPGLDAARAAHDALDQIYGADINPYAVAIARFRLTLEFLATAGYERLRAAPQLPLHLAVADSLLHNPQLEQQTLGQLDGQSAADWEGQAYALDDEQAARDVLHRRYAAVVGNPPYITVKDKVLRDRYRELYPSAFRSYSLGVPFTERFFQLARVGGAVGMITANSFMKREFGKKLIEEYLPTVNLDRIVNTSGAYIPGHGTPTVLLFGTAEPPLEDQVLAVLAKRGEPTTPEDAEQGHVWRSIADHGEEVGFDDDYVTVARVGRPTLAAHPWSLAGGGASELKELLEARAAQTLGDVCELPIGRAARTGEDDAFAYPQHVMRRLELPPSWKRELVIGEAVRDWALGELEMITFPYDADCGFRAHDINASSSEHALKLLWPWRTRLAARSTFQGDMADAGLAWFEYMQYTASANATPLSITFAFVATHNHFVLDRGGKVFKQSAPIIKLPEDATEDDHLALLAYLNSSTACFWMKQVFMNKGGSGIGRGIQDEAWEARYEFDGTKLASFPTPVTNKQLVAIAKTLLSLGETMKKMVSDTTVEVNQVDSAFATMVALQEELDWTVYVQYGLLPPPLVVEHQHLVREGVGDLLLIGDHPERLPQLQPGDRPFEHTLLEECAKKGRDTTWFARNRYSRPRSGSWEALPKEYRALLEWRKSAIASHKELMLVETPEFKRRWNVPDVTTVRDRVNEDQTLVAAEQHLRMPTIVPQRALGADDGSVGALATGTAVPFAAALRYSDAGFEKHAVWQHTWALQRREDAGEDVGDIPVPPKYASTDFRSPTYWRLRGKLDVPKERFISYPGCESDEDGEPLYGWAGWNHLEQAQALAALYQERKNDGWLADRLTPMLAGLLELVPWVKQWHNEPSEEFGGLKLGDYFESFVAGECSALGLTEDDLRGWRPPEKTRGGRRKKKG
ncbi:MAG: BREX-2 system adenine-specific DNA-methyltransferase PglX [Polyangiaceae bacterium]